MKLRRLKFHSSGRYYYDLSKALRWSLCFWGDLIVADHCGALSFFLSLSRSLSVIFYIVFGLILCFTGPVWHYFRRRKLFALLFVELWLVNFPSRFTNVCSSSRCHVVGYVFTGLVIVALPGHLLYSRTSLSRTRLFRITAYLEVNIWSLC